MSLISGEMQGRSDPMSKLSCGWDRTNRKGPTSERVGVASDRSHNDETRAGPVRAIRLCGRLLGLLEIFKHEVGQQEVPQMVDGYTELNPLSIEGGLLGSGQIKRSIADKDIQLTAACPAAVCSIEALMILLRHVPLHGR